MQPYPIFLQISLGIPSECMFCLICHLTILEWWQWSHLTFNQSIEILILGFSPFFLKTSIILHNKKTQGFRIDREPHWRMAMDCYTLVYDQVKHSWFKVIEWCQGSVDPIETQWHGLILKEFIQRRLPLD